MNKYKPLSLAAILALIFTLSACSEQLLETVAEDPEPDTISGEADSTTSQVLAENSADDERSPQPNDITLGSYNGSDENESNDINGQSNLMPVRIPFNGAITDLYNDNGSLNETAASLYVSNIAIIEFNASNNSPTGIAVLPLPVNDRAGNLVSAPSGVILSPTFKAVYQDTNYDLVLVPGTNTFKSSTADTNYSYSILIHQDLNGSNGENIIPDTLTELLTTSNKLIDDANTTIYSSILEDADDDGNDNDPEDRATVASLEQARRLYVGEDGAGGTLLTAQSLSSVLGVNFNFTSNSEIASAFHFTTSADTSANVYGGIDGMFGIAASTTIDEDLIWLNATLDGTSTSAIDLKSTVEGLLGTSFSAISVIYKGFFSCTNFLENEGNDTTISATGADSDRWDLNNFAKLTSYSTGAITSLADCPNALNDLNGTIGFWVTTPVTESGTTPYGTVVFQHGITGNKDNLFAIANTLANYGYSSVAIDIWGHGERTYEDGDDDGVIENTLETSYADSGALFIRPDAPDLSAGYYLQTLVDIYRLSSFISNNPELSQAVGTNTPIHYVGMSLGGIMGASLSSMSSITSTSTDNFADPFTKYVLNVPGGDISDIVLNGSFGASIRNSVAAGNGYDTSTVEGQQSLSSAMVAVDLLTSNTLFSLSADPLATITSSLPTQVLVQEIQGDEVVPNNTTELMAQSMNLTNYNDGDPAVDDTSANHRVRWRLDPSNYDKENDGGDAGHGFLLNNESNATAQGQLQVACYLLFNRVLNTKATINPETCTNL